MYRCMYSIYQWLAPNQLEYCTAISKESDATVQLPESVFAH